MIVFIIRAKDGGYIKEVNRTLEGAGLTLYGHGEGTFADGSPFTLVSLREKMEQAAAVEVNYSSGDVLLLERHFVAG